MKTDFAMLAHSYDPSKTYKGWFASRKLNGWGAMWDGGLTRGMRALNVPWYYEGGDARLKDPVMSTGLWTIGRNNKPKVINAPEWWLNALPIGCPLHGELWVDDDLAKVKSICGQGINGRSDNRWSSVTYQVYNSKPYHLWEGSGSLLVKQSDDFLHVASHHVQNYPWNLRMRMVRQSVDAGFYTVGDIVKQVEVDGNLDSLISDARDEGHEGIMLINPNSYYEPYRSRNLLKVKPQFETEATVLGYEDGKGKHVGSMGAINCSLTWDEKVLSFTGGTQEMVGKKVFFKVGGGFTDEQRDWHHARKHWPILGEIHFTFLNVSNDGVPCSANQSEA